MRLLILGCVALVFAELIPQIAIGSEVAKERGRNAPMDQSVHEILEIERFLGVKGLAEPETTLLLEPLFSGDSSVSTVLASHFKEMEIRLVDDSCENGECRASVEGRVLLDVSGRVLGFVIDRSHPDSREIRVPDASLSHFMSSNRDSISPSKTSPEMKLEEVLLLAWKGLLPLRSSWLIVGIYGDLHTMLPADDGGPLYKGPVG